MKQQRYTTCIAGKQTQDPEQVFVRHILANSVCPLYKLQCVARHSSVQNAKPGWVGPLENANVPNMNIRYIFSRDATTCSLHFVAKPASYPKTMYPLVSPMRFAFCTGKMVQLTSFEIAFNSRISIHFAFCGNKDFGEPCRAYWIPLQKSPKTSDKENPGKDFIEETCGTNFVSKPIG